MDHNHAIGLAMGAGILGSFATYIMMNNSSEESDSDDDNVSNNTQNDEVTLSEASDFVTNVKKAVSQEIKTKSKENTSQWSSFWKQQYNESQDEETKIEKA